MSKPTADTKWSLSGTKTEPSSGQKDAGWVVGQKPPAQWLNWWMDAVDQWKVWLAAFENTAHTWTAKQTFTDVIVSDGGANSSAALEATGAGNRAGLLGNSGPTTGAYGTKGIGANGGAFGKHGLLGQGGSGTSLGGTGMVGVGGDITGAGAGTAGQGGQWFGGNVDGSTNALAAAGRAGVFQGGNVTSDAAGRLGGVAVEATGGLGQAGYAAAFRAVHGGLTLEDGVIIADNNLSPHVIGSTQVDGDLTVNSNAAVLGNANISGSLTVGGSIGALEAKTALTLVPAWANLGGGYAAAAAWKDKQAIVNLEGDVFGGATGTLITVLPVGYRPAFAQSFPGRGDSVNNKAALITVFANGDVVAAFATGHAGNVSLSGIRFRTD